MKLEAALKLLEASGGKNDNEILRQLIQSLEPSRGTGWISFTDTVYTSSNPLTVPANTRTRVMITDNGPDANGDYRGSMPVTIWNNSAFYGQFEGDSYLIRIGYTLKTSQDIFSPFRGLLSFLTGQDFTDTSEQENKITWELDFGVFDIKGYEYGSRKLNGIVEGTHNILVQVRGPNSPITTNGGEIYLTTELASEAYGFDISIQRLFSVER